MNSASTLKDQVAVITGASSGIGAAVARNLSQAGMKLVLTARRSERIDSLAKEIGESASLMGDITEPSLPQKLLDLALQRFGRCDVICNNAGVVDVGPIEEIDIERVCRMVRINVEAAFRLAYAAVRHFKRINQGHLVNTSSILGTKVRPTAGAYAGTKYAIEALSEGLRMELAGTNVKVSCIEPGLVLTELHNHWKVHPTKSMNISSPLQPEDIARTIRFLLEQPAHIRIPRLLIMPGEQQL
ncbi:MAG: SDR family oxidoreductase [Verrucomicrobia bacterium]|nr:SDR family oxidoreductase [Verrucomicrobiota bacterium]